MTLTIPDFDKSINSNILQNLNFNHLDSYLADLLLEKEIKRDEHHKFFIMYLSMRTRNGDVCIDIKNDNLLNEYLKEHNLSFDNFYKEIRILSSVGDKLSDLPIIIHDNLCYLNRFYRYEKYLASWLLKKSEFIDISKDDLLKLKNQIIPKYFNDDNNKINWQKFSAILACFSKFCAISGGPGTGKTTTIVKIIAVLQELNETKHLNIKLCAPTGKAASRLIEALNNVREKSGNLSKTDSVIPRKAYTIHRLLEYLPHKRSFKYNTENRLNCDLIIVDEASMVDLKLMTSLCKALHDSCRLILVGDRFQLASVSPGSVLGDICKRGDKIEYSSSFSKILLNFYDSNLINGISNNDERSFSDSIAELKKSYRFDENSGIGLIAENIKNGNFSKTFEILNSDNKDVLFKDPGSFTGLEELIKTYTDKYYFKLLNCNDIEKSFELFSDFMILSPLREGPYGILNINNLVEKQLGNCFKVNTDFWYHGKPVMITKNDYKNQLYNGDTGLCLRDEDLELKIFFKTSENTFRKIHPVRLNFYESVYSMTVHKSQGSEFNNVFIVLPDNNTSSLSRELIYTAVTRAKKSVVIAGSKTSLESSIKNNIKRVSGLYKDLWE